MMCWSFVIAVGTGFIQRTFSEPHFSLPQGFDGKAIREVSRSNDPAAQMNSARGVSSFEQQQNTKYKWEKNNEDLGNNYHLASVLAVEEQKEHGPYSWEKNLFEYIYDASLDYLDHMHRSVEKLSISEKVRAMEEDCSLLRKNMESFSGVLWFITNSNYKNAYELLDDKLRQMKSLWFTLFNSDKQRIYVKHSPVHKLDLDSKWKILVHCTHHTISELELLVLHSKAPETSLKKHYHHILQAQVLGILNFFLKYKLIDNKFFNEWIHKKCVYELILEHIIDLSSDSTLYDIGIRQSLIKNRSLEHFEFVLKFLTQKDWKYIDYECFKKKKGYFFQPSYINLEPRLREMAERFCTCHFEKCEISNLDEEGKMVKDLIQYFNSSPCPYHDLKAYSTYGILYEMICFIIKYHTKIFTSSFENGNMAKIFSLKLVVLDSAIKLLRSSNEIEFMAVDGFWTQELDGRESQHLVSLEKAYTQISMGKNGLQFFQNQFGCQSSKEFNKYMILKGFIKHEKKTEVLHSSWINVNDFCINPFGFFGTNFELKVPEDENAQRFLEKKHSKSKMISQKFLGEVYGWVDGMEGLLSNFSENQKTYVEIIMKILLAEKNKSKGTEIANWITEFPMINIIYDEIQYHLETSQVVWDRFKTRMDYVNFHIQGSIICSPEQIFDYQVSKRPKLLKEELKNTNIPEKLNFSASSQNISDKMCVSSIIPIPKLEFVNETPFIQQMSSVLIN